MVTDVRTEAPPSANPSVPLASIDVEIEDGLVIVHASVDGRPRNLILDTGSSITVFDVRYADSRGLCSVEGTARVQGGGAGTPTVKLATADSIRIGSLNLRDQRVALVDFSAASAAFGRQIDGTLGYDVFANYTVRIDYRHRRVEFFSRGSFTLPPNSKIIPIDVSRRVPVTSVTLVAPDGQTLPAQLVFDMGTSGIPLQLSPSFVAKHDLIRRAGDRTLNAPVGVGVGGVATGRFARLKEARVASLSIESPVAGLWTDQSPLPLDGTIGAVVLDQHVIVIDYANNRVVVESPASVIPQRAFPDASGLTLMRPGDGTTTISYVAPNSPASAVDLRAGDELVSIDGQRASDQPLAVVRLALGKPGSTQAITIRRNGQLISVHLQLHNLL